MLVLDVLIMLFRFSDVQIASSEEGKKILDAWLETPFKAPCPASDGCPWNNEIDQFLDASIQEMERISQAALENDVPVDVDGSSMKDVKAVEKTSPPPRSSIQLLNSLLETINLAPSIDDTHSKPLPSDAFFGGVWILFLGIIGLSLGVLMCCMIILQVLSQSLKQEPVWD